MFNTQTPPLIVAQGQQGLIRLVPIFLIVASVGIISFLVISSSVPLKDNFNDLFPKPDSRAATGPTIFVNPSQVLHNSSSYVLSTNRNHVVTQHEFPNGPQKLEKMKELTPTWGQGKYLYRQGHGPTDGRLDVPNQTGYHFEQKWGTKTTYPFETTPVYPYDDIRDYLYEANTWGADQIHVINFGTSDASEAGRFVSYLNKSTDSNRVAHPYPQQNVKLFELGNEISWRLVRGHSQFAPSETAYATRSKQFAQTMRANSDVPIQIGLVASTNSNFVAGDGWSEGAIRIRNILNIMGDQVNFLIFHGYPSWPLYTVGEGDQFKMQIMAQNEWNNKKLETVIKPAIVQNANGRDVWLANTESYAAYDDKFSRGMFGALYNADSIVTAMKQDVRIVTEFGFSHGILRDSRFFFGNDPNKTTPIFLWQKMLAGHWGDKIVQTSQQQIPTVLVTAAENVTLPKLGFTASVKGDKEYVLVVNRVNDTDVVSNIDPGFVPTCVTAYEIAGTNGWDATTFSCDMAENNCLPTTDGVAIKTITNPNLTNYNFKKASITIFEIAGLTNTLDPSPSPSVTPGSILGDVDGDGDVDIFDYNAVVTDFGKTGPDILGDVDHDNDVDIFDYNIVVSNFGT